MDDVLPQLHAEPALRFKLAVNVLGHSPESGEAGAAREVVRQAEIIQNLLSERDAQGCIPCHPYKKWGGAHWVLAILADLGYPPGDAALRPMLEQCYQWLLGAAHAKNIRTINGRVRRCASQEGYAVWYSLRLGLADDCTQELCERLMRWQWPDGGWNCDKHPQASQSSFMETLIPLRALALYASLSGDAKARQFAEQAAEIFLKRELFKRRSDGRVINHNFICLHYPCYWHYDILFALRVMLEAGFIQEPRCTAALDLLESKRLPDGGFPAEKTYYRLSNPAKSGYSRVGWGGTSLNHMNPFVTADALQVLRAAGRCQVLS